MNTVSEFFDDLASTILILNALAGGWLLPVVAGVLILTVVAFLWALWDRLRGLPRTPTKVERILAEDAARLVELDGDREPTGDVLDGVVDDWTEEWKRQQGRRGDR